jgi:hypothetical protein
MEFTGLSGQVIYLYKEQTFRSGLQVQVHPELNESPLRQIPGVKPNDQFPFRSGSNMRRFPKRKSPEAANPIAYSRSLIAEDISALERLLAALNAAPIGAKRISQRRESLTADQRATEREERAMNVCMPFAARVWTPILREPRERALDHPSVTLEPLPRLDTDMRDPMLDVSRRAVAPAPRLR